MKRMKSIVKNAIAETTQRNTMHASPQHVTAEVLFADPIALN
jgi:hypothetical protein